MTARRIIVVATAREEELAEFREALAFDNHTSVVPAGTPEEVLETVLRTIPALVVIDGDMAEDSGLALVRRLLQINAFIHTAVISDMDAEAFHQHSEGLGVLARLPQKPSAQDARNLLSLLESIV